MDDLTAVLCARKVLDMVKPTALPVPVERYAEAVGAVIRYRNDLDGNQPGLSFPAGDRWIICVNAEDPAGRQNFTACHEIAHIALKLPSEHTHDVPGWSFGRRPQSEILCDRFAAELLLPHSLFKPLVERVEIGFPAVKDLAERFDASLTATGIRFVTVATAPCAFVVSERGQVRYSLRSTSLRNVGAWIPPGNVLPRGSVSLHVREGGMSEGPEVAEPDDWFRGWEREGGLLEDAVHLPQWDQTLTLLWFEDEELPPQKGDPRDLNRDEEGEQGVKELDGVLPWPGKSRPKK